MVWVLGIGGVTRTATEATAEMAGPLAVAMGAPMLQPLADTLRTLGSLREQLSLKTQDCVVTQVCDSHCPRYDVPRQTRNGHGPTCPFHEST